MGVFEELRAEDPQQVGPYRIVARLGAGGMGRVYLGRSKSGRAVAVKVVRPVLAEDREFRRRFAREVALARTVSGFFTAGVVDADPQGAPPWLATAYVPGISLDEAVAEHGPWQESHVLALGAGLAEALEAIHAAGVVHRDLKPSNVLLAADGPRVIDFGISVAVEASRLTETGVFVGTPGFMSPEQLTGAPVGPANDVFCLGAVLVFTATGTGPFGTGSSQAMAYRIVHQEPDLTAVPPRLRSVVARCLAKQPEQRPSAAALLDELAESIAGRATIVEFFTDSAWLPDSVAQVVRTRVTTPDGDLRNDQATVESPHGRNGVKRPRPAVPSGSRREAVPEDPKVGRPTGMARRSALLGLAGIGAAAVGIAGWKLLENTGEPTSPAAARTPASPTLSGRDPSPSPEGSEPSALPKVPDKLTMQTHPGPGTTVEGYVTDRDAEIAYARFGEPWQKADLAPFTYAQRAGAAGFPQALIGSAPYPEAVPGALTDHADHADHADYRDLAARAAQWSLRYQPPGSAITWNASEVVRRGMGWLLGYSVDYLADGRQRTSLAVVAVVNSESRKPAMLFATVPDDQPALYRDLNMLIWSLVPV